MVFKGIDDKNVLSIIDLWNECLTSDVINEKNFYNRIIFDVNFDTSNFIVAYDGSETVGFIYGTKRIVCDEVAGLQDGTAWIVEMGVKKKYRRQGIGTELVKKLENKFHSEGVNRIDLCNYSSNYITPGVDNENYQGSVNFFEKLGYKQYGKSVAMEMKLNNYTYLEKYKAKKKQLLEEGIRVVPFEYMYALSVKEFFKNEFEHWWPVCRNLIITTEEESPLFIALDKDEKTVGFVMRSMDGTPERFGPFGMSESLQGKSIGSLLFNELRSCMQ